MPETGGLDLGAVVVVDTSTQAAFHGRQVHRLNSQLGQHPQTVDLRGRFHQPGEHQLEERLIGDHVEPQTPPRRGNHIDQQLRRRPVNHRPGTSRDTLLIQPQVQAGLVRVQPVVPDLQQRRQFGLVMGRAEMLKDPALTMTLLRDLDRHRPRGGLHLPQERTHPTDPTRVISAPPPQPKPSRQALTPT